MKCTLYNDNLLPVVIPISRSKGFILKPPQRSNLNTFLYNIIHVRIRKMLPVMPEVLSHVLSNSVSPVHINIYRRIYIFKNLHFVCSSWYVVCYFHLCCNYVLLYIELEMYIKQWYSQHCSYSFFYYLNCLKSLKKNCTQLPTQRVVIHIIVCT